MPITNHERVGKMLAFLTAGLQPFVERELKAAEQRLPQDARPCGKNADQ